MKILDRTPLWLPTAALVFGIVAVSMAAILVRWANAPATVMGFWRMFIASLVMLFPVMRSTQHPIRNLSNTKLDLRPAMIAGIFFAFSLATWNLGALATTAANVTLLGNLDVVWVPLVTMHVFKRKLRGAFWIGLVCAMIGVVIILGQDMLAHPALCRRFVGHCGKRCLHRLFACDGTRAGWFEYAHRVVDFDHS